MLEILREPTNTAGTFRSFPKAFANSTPSTLDPSFLRLESVAFSSRSSTPLWFARRASAKRWVASEPMALFGGSAAKVTSAIRPNGARSSRAGTWLYLDAHAASASEPQTASACCKRTCRFALVLSILGRICWGHGRDGQEARQRANTTDMRRCAFHF